MSQFLVFVVGGIYSAICVDQTIKGEYAMAGMWFGYALSNGALFFVTK